MAEIVKRVKGVIYGRPSGMYPPSVRNFIAKHGNDRITNVKVKRVPIASSIMTAGNLVTGGDLMNKMKQMNIDKLRHLYVVFSVNGVEHFVEKNEDIQVKQDVPREGAEMMFLGNPKNDLTVAELFDTIIKNHPNINHYNAFSANCQNFASIVLKTLGLFDNEADKFVNQPVAKLVSPFLKKVAKGATDLASRLNILRTGVGRRPFKQMPIRIHYK